MINPAIETDLVGETVRIDVGKWKDDGTPRLDFTTAIAGRIRAVTAGMEGGLCVWVEIIDEDGARCVNRDSEWMNVAIGDVFPYYIGKDDGRSTRLHIMRGPR